MVVAKKSVERYPGIDDVGTWAPYQNMLWNLKKGTSAPTLNDKRPDKASSIALMYGKQTQQFKDKDREPYEADLGAVGYYGTYNTSFNYFIGAFYNKATQKNTYTDPYSLDDVTYKDADSRTVLSFAGSTKKFLGQDLALSFNLARNFKKVGTDQIGYGTNAIDLGLVWNDMFIKGLSFGTGFKNYGLDVKRGDTYFNLDTMWGIGLGYTRNFFTDQVFTATANYTTGLYSNYLQYNVMAKYMFPGYINITPELGGEYYSIDKLNNYYAGMFGLELSKRVTFGGKTYQDTEKVPALMNVTFDIEKAYAMEDQVVVLLQAVRITKQAVDMYKPVNTNIFIAPPPQEACTEEPDSVVLQLKNVQTGTVRTYDKRYYLCPKPTLFRNIEIFPGLYELSWYFTKGKNGSAKKVSEIFKATQPKQIGACYQVVAHSMNRTIMLPSSYAAEIKKYDLQIRSYIDRKWCVSNVMASKEGGHEEEYRNMLADGDKHGDVNDWFSSYFASSASYTLYELQKKKRELLKNALATKGEKDPEGYLNALGLTEPHPPKRIEDLELNESIHYIGFFEDKLWKKTSDSVSLSREEIKEYMALRTKKEQEAFLIKKKGYSSEYYRVDGSSIRTEVVDFDKVAVSRQQPFYVDFFIRGQGKKFWGDQQNDRTDITAEIGATAHY